MTFTTFAVTGNYEALAPGAVVNGNVLFTPNLVGVTHGSDGGTSVSVVGGTVQGRIINGILQPTSTVAATVLLYSNDPNLNLNGQLQYTVTFSHVTADSTPISIASFSFNAPADSTPVDLPAITPSSPIPVGGTLSVTSTEISDATALGRQLLTAPDAATARSDLGISGGGGGSPQVIGEVPTGTVNGTNTVFTTASAYLTNSTAIYRNGLRQLRGTDYTESGASQITFSTAPSNGTTLIIDYLT